VEKHILHRTLEGRANLLGVAELAERSTLIGGVVDIEVRLKASRCDWKTARHSEQLKSEAWRFSDCHFHIMTQ
jgi:uncharacterized small protein (DUF1192 family)